MKMRSVILGLLGLALLHASICDARNYISSRPSDQIPVLPKLPASPSDKPFELPPLQQSSPGKTPQLGTAITLRSIRFRGNTVIDQASLETVAKPFLNRAMDAGELEELRFRLTKLYVDKGYVNSGASIPKQILDHGELTIDLIEGRLTEINIEGNGWLHPDYIKNRLQSSDPLNVEELQERYLLLLNDPLIKQLNGALKPLPTPGQSALDLKVTRALPYQVTIHGNNYNPPSIGAEQLQTEAWVRNLTRWGDKFDFRYDFSDGASVYAGGIMMPLNARGTVFDFHFETGRSSIVEEPLNAIDITSRVKNFNWTLSHPLLRSIDQNLTVGAIFAARTNQTSVVNNPCYSFVKGLEGCKSKATVLRLFQEYSGRFERNVIALRSTFSIGLDAFNSTIQTQRSDPDSDFFAWLGQFQYAYQVLDNGAQLRLHGNLQLSNDPLLPQERISVGGVYSVRGYRENELVRDNGYNGSIEFHYPLFNTSGAYGQQLSIFPFMDYGAAWNHHEPTDYLHAVGVGLSWQGFKHFKADFIYAHDLNKDHRKPTHNLQDDGIFFNVSYYLF